MSEIEDTPLPGMGQLCSSSCPPGRWTRYIPLALGLITFLTFSPALWNGFVAWDDNYNFTGNPHYRGLGWEQLRWMFTTTLMENYVPVAWFTLGLDYVVWGMNPAGYHLTNLFLHAVNCVLFYFVALALLERATTLAGMASRVGAGAASLFFSIHPLRVESVAWISERRDVLSGAFFFLTILLYLRAVEAGGPRRRRLFAASVGAYALAVASKSMVMTVPVILVLLDLYPLRRLSGNPRQWLDRSARRVWLEKVPYLVLGLAGAVTVYFVHARHSAVTILGTYPGFGKVAYSLWFYVHKTLLPRDLSPLYELPQRLDPLDPPFLIAAVSVTGISIAVIALRRAWPAGLAIWVYYGIVLVPVAGFVHTGNQLTADRYSYLSCLGWALLVGAAAGALARPRLEGARGRTLRPIGAVGVAIWLVALGAATWRQVHVWRSTETLWTHAIQVTPDCGICHEILGVWLMSRGRTLSGLDHLHRAAVLRPSRDMAYGRLGQAYEALGMLSEAISEYQRELALRPAGVEARGSLGRALLLSGKPADALVELRQAELAQPNDSALHTSLGLALDSLGRSQEAVPHFLRAIELRPGAVEPRLGLTQAYLHLGETELARDQYEALRILDPALARRIRASFEPG